MKHFEVKLDDVNNTPINAGRSFSVTAVHLTTSGIAEQVVVPDNAIEAICRSDVRFSVAVASVHADGYEATEMKFGVVNMEEIYLTSSIDNQKVYIMWILL